MKNTVSRASGAATADDTKEEATSSAGGEHS